MSDSWSRLEAERRELADQAERFADLGLGVHAEQLNRGGPIQRLHLTPLILDTDIGGDPDDAVALVLAARTCPQLTLVVTSDEIDGERARFARYLLDLAGRHDVPVVAGRALSSQPLFSAQGLIHPQVGQQSAEVAQAVAWACGTTDGPVRWVGMGPLTNLAELVRTRPDLVRRLAVTQMGGAINYRDPTRAEHNFRLDPVAARTVLAELPDIHLVLSDVTFTPAIAVDTTSPIYQDLGRDGAPGWAQVVRVHMDRWFAQFHPSTLQHDPLTLSAALQLPFVSFELTTVVLDEAARMSRSPDGHRHFLSTRARYDAFTEWMRRGLTTVEPQPST